MKYYISTPKFTCKVEVDNNKIVKAAPILSKFLGQPFTNLQNWLSIKFKNVIIKEI